MHDDGGRRERVRDPLRHKFRVGDSVRVSRGRFPDRSGAGIYEVVRLLPETEGEFQYRIKSAGASAERMVREGEIERV